MADTARETVTRDVERFWSKVTKTDTCWLWTAYLRRGYGKIKISNRTVLAHRFAYEMLVGPIPDGLQLDHLCRVRNCVNPAHLEPVTSRENTLRGATPAALNAAKTHCKNGHEYTPENTYLIKPTKTQPNGARACRTCRRAAHSRLTVKRREARS